jgi:hypothetical protein
MPSQSPPLPQHQRRKSFAILSTRYRTRVPGNTASALSVTVPEIVAVDTCAHTLTLKITTSDANKIKNIRFAIEIAPRMVFSRPSCARFPTPCTKMKRRKRSVRLFRVASR